MDADLERVEVRSLEDGFLGSWQSGTVVAREPGGFLVKYDHLLGDDNVSAPLCERVDLSGLASDPPRGCRGLIRPLREGHRFACCASSRLRYGLCVDAFYNDAWWEGVIFDHLDGSESRRVLFPDLGDELSIPVGLLRETLDWNEATNEWERRGCWVFLMVIEDYCQQFGSLWVSIRQIWYDVRKKECFRTFGDWTYSEKCAWVELVSEVMDDNLRLNLDGLFRLMDSEEEAAGHGDLSVECTLPEDQHQHHNGSFSPRHCPRRKTTPTSSRQAKSECWQLAGPDIVPGPKFQPSAITEYVGRSSNSDNVTKKKNLNVLKTNCRSHLAYLGWKILVATEKVSRGKTKGLEFRRMRYVSPCGRNYFSLPQACQYLEEQKCQNLCTPVKPQLIQAVLEPKYCPQAVQDWFIFGVRPKENSPNKKELRAKAMGHLAALGWTIWYTYKGSKRELRFKSPAGKSFFSLRTACKWCMDEEGGASRIDASDCKVAGSVKALELFKEPSQNLGASAQTSSQVESAVESAVVGLTNQRKRKPRSVSSRRKKKKLSPAPAVGGNNGSYPAHAGQLVVRSSSKHIPRTVLSWLIDNNVVLPRAKVEYRCREDNCRMAAGRVTRAGIKCSCCQNVLSLMRFEAHAGSNYHQPAANIFLEDGRSLLDCQMQIMSNDDGVNFPSEPKYSTMSHQHHHQHESDYVCSICRFGGELILCDQCPSSFHKNCVGLKDIPDGNWFCPFCCCRICGQRELNGDSDEDIKSSLLSCSQCEHQYHGCCLKEKLETNHQDWFCSEICKKIFISLHEIVGKTVSLDSNFSWTLLRANKYDRNDCGSIDIEAVAENYSKLNVAIGVMHECFEPVQEAYTGSDLVEDVIFSKGSQLKRLNFRRFYTVLLERNEEVISVAAIRVHDNKVAEIPLVATRFQYRRLGMCRILMKQLETMVTTLGIERLVLPAAESVLNTWTASFGFSKMMDHERLDLLDYTFLDFAGTAMCQKFLMRIPLIESKRIQHKLIKTKRPSDLVAEMGNYGRDGKAVRFAMVSESFKHYKPLPCDSSPLCSIDYGGEDHMKEYQELALLKGQPDCYNSTECHIEYAGGTQIKKFQEPSLPRCKPLHCDFSTESCIEDVSACHMKSSRESAPLGCEPLRSEINTKCSFEVVGHEKEFQLPSPRSLKFRIKINRESPTLTAACNKSFSHIATHYKCYKRR